MPGGAASLSLYAIRLLNTLPTGDIADTSGYTRISSHKMEHPNISAISVDMNRNI